MWVLYGKYEKQGAYLNYYVTLRACYETRSDAVTGSRRYKHRLPGWIPNCISWEPYSNS